MGREDATFGFIAHIVGDSVGGPRGDAARSPLLARSLDNLMLMCARHHKLIDVVNVAGHPEAALLAMKAEHESRIQVVTAIDEDRASHVIRFGANIGENEALVSTKAIFAAMPPHHHPASGQTIDLELVGCAYSCPALLDAVEGDVYLGFDTLTEQCAQGVRVCASGNLRWRP